jgi:broad specificity phosphatase PhoE
MAGAAALALQDDHAPVARVIASPLQRTQESAAPVARAFGVEVETDERLIEPHNHFEGLVMKRAVRDPRNWFALRNPRLPSWGEPYTSISARMLAAVSDAWESTDEGDVVLVSHQLPIWMVHSTVTHTSLPHDPRQRRCALSSITTLERRGDAFVEVAYRDPGAGLATAATDVGAV